MPRTDPGAVRPEPSRPSLTPLRQDGTFPDPAVTVGEVLVPAGTLGQIVDIGVYLQEHIVYAVAFGNGRLVGCLERELERTPGPAVPTGGEA
ncbi:MAG TPA: nitrogen fixation protein NifZ [Kineosporiaceae bacterium]|nr:nitrogen fixation protein NifZ [Kineosporiaceae bacterium]